MNTFPNGTAGNYVIIDHGLGREAWYFHLKKDSPTVAIGDYVVAGQQLGLVASSGNSSWPHLHFETRYLGATFEPHSGPCRPGPSWWQDQAPLVEDTYLLDFGITTEDLFARAGLPYPMPVDAQFALSDGFVYLWFEFVNLPVDSTWRFVFYRPDGTVALDSGSEPFGYPDSYRGGWVFFYWWVDDMHTIPGTWHVDVHFHDTLVVHAPLEVVATADSGFNRPPEPVTVSFDPPAPTATDAVFCWVAAPVVLDDLDWDVVRYHYVWQMNGKAVRDVVSAGRADAVPRGAAIQGGLLTCTVTPGDGKTEGAAVSVSALVGGPAGPADVDQDGDVDLLDYAAMQLAFTGP